MHDNAAALGNIIDSNPSIITSQFAEEFEKKNTSIAKSKERWKLSGPKCNSSDLTDIKIFQRVYDANIPTIWKGENRENEEIWMLNV
ncbi:hypothetical protein DAI22_07g094950 [Oryza sativa Japonica Group]|jgi:hypothetical protein|nr:hypothetical protein DAI22_07g094950 [Oryza sativa Japonica Group]